MAHEMEPCDIVSPVQHLSQTQPFLLLCLNGSKVSWEVGNVGHAA